MRNAREDPSSSVESAVDLISYVKVLHGIGSHKLNKLLKESDNVYIIVAMERGSSYQVNTEKLVRFLPSHLIAVTLSSQRDEASLKYILCGLRLLHSLCEIAPRHPKLEQILLDDVRVSEQLLDLVFYLLIVSSGCRQEHQAACNVLLLHSVLVACSMYLLTGFISSQWHELSYVLLAHPKVDIFMDVAFRAVRRNINFLQMKLSSQHNDTCQTLSCVSERTVDYLCQQCEASLQFLQSLCQLKSFRERLLRNKELCGKGGVLQLVQATLKLTVSPLLRESPAVVAAISRLKSRVLSILLHLCEADSISYLDEVASVPETLNLAKSVVLEVLALLKTMLTKNSKQLCSPSGRTYPTGFLQLNALRLADIFSDDSNFRSYITIYFTEVLAEIFSLPFQDFLSSWCSSDLAVKEEEATLEYEPFASAGWILGSCSSLDLVNAENSESTFIPNSTPQAPYAHQRTSLLVKVIANLHCFVPKICEEQERNLFLHKFLECLQMESSKSTGYSSSDTQKAVLVCKNLGSLLAHAESLIPTFLNEEDVQLLRVFYGQLQPLISPDELEVNQVQEAQSVRQCSSFLTGNLDEDAKSRYGILKEGVYENSVFQEVDNYCVQDGLTDEADGITTQDRRMHKGKITKLASGGLVESEKDVQNVETSGSDSSSNRAKNTIDHVDNDENRRSVELTRRKQFGVLEDEKVGSVHSEGKQPRKRKRTIMNDKQVSIIERALLEEPDMQKNATSLQSWAERLSFHGSEVTSSQLKNWLNNRKARLARAARDSRLLSEVDNSSHNKQGGPGVGPSSDSPESHTEDLHVPSAAKRIAQPHSIPGKLIQDECGRWLCCCCTSKILRCPVGVWPTCEAYRWPREGDCQGKGAPSARRMGWNKFG
ncbi:hypothetical protein Nepgr_032850 [Nepenthes gracilis]|uniref:Homeobox domain-containing protein n=1 Tax=Nepenthes gracilis TaxID=150966 RepID=A0AAD3TLL6_NEPGR|nr:hypothetical protein Nepgr_032850 [Nepenthes gracilis]